MNRLLVLLCLVSNVFTQSSGTFYVHSFIKSKICKNLLFVFLDYYRNIPAIVDAQVRIAEAIYGNRGKICSFIAII